MIGLFETFMRPLLFRLDAENAHALSIAGLKTGATSLLPCRSDPRLAATVAGMDFPNPIGLAAGYDKNCEVPDALLGLGFGFVETGTVTPLPQTGNPKPRVFRLPEDRAVINRLGFNNEGHDAFHARLSARTPRGVVGVNIGANKDSSDRIADYEKGVRRFAPLASYLTINISSPNTPGLRALQSRAALAELLGRAKAARPRAVSGRKPTPLFLKIAPDMPDDELSDVAEEVLAKKIDGVIVSNTTLARTGLTSENAAETGGLSGTPLFNRSTIVLARLRKLVGKKLPLIGVGGIDSTETAIEKIRAGADLVQIYTGLIYRGPELPRVVTSGLARYLDRNGLSSLRQIRDSGVEEWASKIIR